VPLGRQGHVLAGAPRREAGCKARRDRRLHADVQRYPFSWYALLARSRLKALGVASGPFGIEDAKPRGPKLAAAVDESLARDEIIARADELVAAKLEVDAGFELHRGERGFLKRHDRAAAFAMLLDRYRKAGNYNRPWMLAISYNGRARWRRRRRTPLVGRVSARTRR
jgi:hypothetical protein